jgi:hypothetical protein
MSYTQMLIWECVMELKISFSVTVILWLYQSLWIYFEIRILQAKVFVSWSTLNWQQQLVPWLPVICWTIIVFWLDFYYYSLGHLTKYTMVSVWISRSQFMFGTCNKHLSAFAHVWQTFAQVKQEISKHLFASLVGLMVDLSAVLYDGFY